MWAIISIGLVLRAAQYGTNRSLWFDEVLLALNIVHRPLRELFQPLDYHQGAPFGFLLLEKLATKLAGNSEMALRATPFAFGTIGLLFFPRLAKLYVSPRSVLLAVSLFAFCGPLIYYSSEAKQYSSDVAVTMMLLWLLSKLASAPLSAKELIRYSLLGAISVWFSHPAAFVLAGGGLALLCFALIGHEWLRLRRLLLVFAAWGLSFLGYYSISLRALSSDRALLDFWREYFAPQPFWSAGAVSFLFERFFALFDDPAQIISVAGAVCFVLGCARMARRRDPHFWLLAGPLLLAIFAAFLQLYPLGGRLFLFALPILFLIVGEGTSAIASMNSRFARPLQVMVIFLLLARPVWMDAQTLVHPQRPEDIKPAIQYIRTHQLPGDAWYVYHWARYQFSYYSERDQINPEKVWIGVDCGIDQACYITDLNKLRGQPRVWILFSHIWVGDGLQEETFFLEQLDRIGVRKDAYRSTGARAYLYDFSQSADASTQK
jgi:hypothetical protein